MSRCWRVEVEVNHDLTRVLLEETDAKGGDPRLATCVREAVEGRLPRRVVGDRVFDVEGCGHDSSIAGDYHVDHPSLLGFLARPGYPYADRVSRDTFLVGVQRSLAEVDDDRTLRRVVLEQVRRTVHFDAFAWLLTDPDTTVGTAPLAEVPCLDQLPQLVALRYTSGRRWTTTDPGVPHRPVLPGSELARFIAVYGTYDVVSLAFADRFGWWGFLDLWREDGQFDNEDCELLGLLGQSVAAALRESRAAAFVLPERVTPRAAGRSVLLLGPDLSLRRQTAEAEAALRALPPTEESRRPVPAAAYNVAAQLLAVEAGADAHRPVARAAVSPGEWISVQAARLGEDIAVTIGPVEQRERWNLFCRTHALSDRETDVVTYLAEGDDTRTLAARLHLSHHTVQDHLKSAFAKTGAEAAESSSRSQGAPEHRYCCRRTSASTTGGAPIGHIHVPLVPITTGTLDQP